MRANTINPKDLIVVHPNEEILLNGATKIDDTRTETIEELKIFGSTSLDILKLMYYKSIAYKFPKYDWKPRTRYLSKALVYIKKAHKMTDSIWQFSTELKIFISPTLYIFK